MHSEKRKLHYRYDKIVFIKDSTLTRAKYILLKKLIALLKSFIFVSDSPSPGTRPDYYFQGSPR